MTTTTTRPRSKSFRESISDALVRVSSMDMKTSKISAVLGTKITISAPPSITPAASASSPVSPGSPRSSFTTYRVRVYAKDAQGDYRYTELSPTLPTIEISPPPDDDGAASFGSPGSPVPGPKRVATFPEGSGHRRAVSVDANKPLPPLPQRRGSAPTSSSSGVYELEGTLPPPETPPHSPAEDFLPQQFQLPPSPPDTPTRRDSLQWLSLEIARVDGSFPYSPPEELQEQPFIDFSPPTSPFECEFPEFKFPGEEEEEEQAEPTLLRLPDSVLVNIFAQLPSEEAVAALSLTHSSLHRIFTENTTKIITRVASRELSPALRHLISTYNNLTYPSFAAYESTLQQICLITSTIKSAIRQRCANFLSKHLLSPHNDDDDDAAAFDSALLHMWTFSLHFSHLPSDTAAQISYLKSLHLSLQQLKDLLEIYQCIGVLLCPLTTNLELAVNAGVAERESCEEDAELWVVWLQTQELSTLWPVLVAREEDEAARWDAVVQRGLWEWDRSGNRGRGRRKGLRLYLKGAVGEVYKELCEQERRGREKCGGEGVWGETWES
jgi:hypothetical protein